MSRTVPVSSHHKPASTGPTAPVTLFIWDTVTTGTSPTDHAITVITAIEFTRLTHPAPKFSTVVHPWNTTTTPPQPFPTTARLPHAFRDFAAFITDNTPSDHTPLLIAHNAAFHTAFLLAELRRAGITTPDWLFADSLPLFRRVFPDLSATNAPYSLHNLATRFAVHVNKRHHTEGNIRVLRELLILANQRLTARTDPLHHTLRPDAKSLHHLAERFVQQSSSSHTHPPLPYITTRNGRYVHMDEACRNLRSAKELIRVELPDPRFLRCYLCYDDNPPFANANTNELLATTPCEYSSSSDTTDGHLSGVSDHKTDHPILEDNSGLPSFTNNPSVVSAPSTLNGTYITTRSGRFYHTDRECRNLRNAKKLIPVTEVPTHLSACYLCCAHSEEAGEKDDEQIAKVAPSTIISAWSAPRKPRHMDSKSPKSCSEQVRHDERIRQVQKRTYITTKYGRLYHMERDCHNLKSAKELIPVDKPPQRLTPCYRCCLHMEDDDLENVPEIKVQSEDCPPCFPPTRVDSNKTRCP